MKAGRRKSKRLWVAAACLAAAAAGAGVLSLRHRPVVPAVSPVSADWTRSVAYVPLDDRTDNTDAVRYEAAACGYTLVLPPEDAYSTRLDGQHANSNGTRYGDRAALFEWVRAMDEQGCNLFLLSLDQLFSGGLVNSRWLSADEDLAFSDGAKESETQAFDRIILALGDDPDNRIYLFDSVMRLASTVGYCGLGLDDYTALRAYGSVPRKTLSGADLTLHNIFAAYPRGADGSTPAKTQNAEAASLTDRQIGNYLSARRRKLRLLAHVLDAVKGRDSFHLLVGVDDSTGGGSIQENEIAYIKAHIGSGAVVSGVDSLARLQLARMALADRPPVTAYVRYFGGGEDSPSSKYDRITLRADVGEQLSLLGERTYDASAADLEILVLTAPKSGVKADETIAALTARLQENQEKGKPTILIDASVGSYEGPGMQALLKNADFAGLLGYAGRYDYASIVGVGLSMGFSRYACLAAGLGASTADDQQRQLANSMLLSMVYAGGVHTQFDRAVAAQGCDSANIVAAGEVYTGLENELLSLLRENSGAVLRNLSSGGVLTDLSGGERGAKPVSLLGAALPWHRSFEVSLSLGVGS
ncbi:MAG: DUF4127 family protein [Oscillospiraceae bacterium]|nr:DUF4127 family protein [Oscillospiraceae bacterium]